MIGAALKIFVSFTLEMIMKFIGILLLFFSSPCFGHGDIELIECFNSDSTKVLRGTSVGHDAADKPQLPQRKKASQKLKEKNAFIFQLMDGANKVLWKSSPVVFTFKDSIQGKKLIDNVRFITKEFSGHLEVHEQHQRLVREGLGHFQLPALGNHQPLKCLVVY